MRAVLTVTHIRLAGVLLAAACGLSAVPAKADRVYADSYGNLVVEADAGYKRIIVGQGTHAKEVADYLRSGAPKVVYMTNDGPATTTATAAAGADTTSNSTVVIIGGGGRRGFGNYHRGFHHR